LKLKRVLPQDDNLLQNRIFIVHQMKQHHLNNNMHVGMGVLKARICS